MSYKPCRATSGDPEASWLHLTSETSLASKILASSSMSHVVWMAETDMGVEVIERAEQLSDPARTIHG